MFVVFEISAPLLLKPYWFKTREGGRSFAWLIFTFYFIPVRFDRFTYEAMMVGAEKGKLSVYRLWNPHGGQVKGRPREKGWGSS